MYIFVHGQSSAIFVYNFTRIWFGRRTHREYYSRTWSDKHDTIRHPQRTELRSNGWDLSNFRNVKIVLTSTKVVRKYKTAKLRNYKTTEVRENETTKVRNNQSTKQRKCETTKVRNCDTTKIRNKKQGKYETTKVRKYETILNLYAWARKCL